MKPEIVISIISGLCVAIPSVLATFFGYMANKKDNKENAKLTIYRIDQLEQKVNKHNQVIERVFKLEGQMSEVQHDISELKKG